MSQDANANPYLHRTSVEKENQVNSKWLPWILSAAIVIIGGFSQYFISRLDRAQEIQTSSQVSQAYLYREYITRNEYDKDYRGLCSRMDKVDAKLDRILISVRGNK